LGGLDAELTAKGGGGEGQSAEAHKASPVSA